MRTLGKDYGVSEIMLQIPVRRGDTIAEMKHQQIADSMEEAVSNAYLDGLIFAIKNRNSPELVKEMERVVSQTVLNTKQKVSVLKQLAAQPLKDKDKS